MSLFKLIRTFADGKDRTVAESVSAADLRDQANKMRGNRKRGSSTSFGVRKSGEKR